MLSPPPAVSPLRLAALAVVVVSSLFAVSPTASAAVVHTEEGAASDWQWPLDTPRMLVRPYIAPATPYAAGHRGIDIGTSAAPAEMLVYAPADGIVHFAGIVVDRPVLSIRHAGGLISSFEPVTTELSAGENIRRGQVVGALGGGVPGSGSSSAGVPGSTAGAWHCTRPCLHFGVRRNGEYVSPLNYLGGIPHSVLLPTRPLLGSSESARSGG